MGRRKKSEVIKVVVPPSTTRETVYICHECGESKPIGAILCVQVKGPLCRVCGGYEKED